MNNVKLIVSCNTINVFLKASPTDLNEQILNANMYNKLEDFFKNGKAALRRGFRHLLITPLLAVS